jgi:hypothetical protein
MTDQRRRLLWTTVLAVACATLAQASGSQVTIRVEPNHVQVLVDGTLFTALHSGDEANKLYLHPLLSASGKRVTRAYPMETVAGESTDHEHQRGVWIGSEAVSGIDFWESERSYDRPNKGTVLLTDVTDVQSGIGEGRFTLHASWNGPDGATRIAETRTMRFRADTTQRIIDIDLRLRAKREVTFEDNHDAILGLRLGTAFEEGHGGRAVNAEGMSGWERLRGARSAWVDWQADVDGERVGVAVMDHPTNFRFPTPWHVRDYALLFASPFASHDYSPTAPDGSLTLKPGQDLTLRYRILVHGSGADIAAAFASFAGR